MNFPAFVNKPINIELTGNPSTGYQWQLDFDPAQIELVADKYEILDKMAVGSPVKHTFTLRPLTIGDIIVTAKLKRVWQENSIEEKEFIFHVEE